MIRIIIIVFIFVSFAGCNDDTEKQFSRIPTRPLAFEPPNKTVLEGSPRNAILKWEPSEGAGIIEYQVEVHYLSGWDGNNDYCFEWEEGTFGIAHDEIVGETEFTISFPGGQPGRWRVRGINEYGKSEWTGWSYFRYRG